MSEEKKQEKKEEEKTEIDKLHKDKKHKKKKVSLSVEEYNKLKQEAELAKESHEKLLRISAEFENTKKRLIKEKGEFKKFANENLISRLLSIVDNFGRAIEMSANTQNLESIIDGIKIVQSEIYKLLEENGVEKIKTVGEKFDPNYHEAIMTVKDDKYSEDTVIEEIQSGYTLNGRLLRPAVVKVAIAEKAQVSKNGEEQTDTNIDSKQINEEKNEVGSDSKDKVIEDKNEESSGEKD